MGFLAAPSTTASANILIGISLDEDDTKELLSWAVTILAHPNDTVVALHVIVGEEPKKLALKEREHKKYGRSRAFVISAMGEFAKTCQSRQVNLEARVRYSSSIGKGLINETKSLSARYLVVGESKTTSKRGRDEVTRYCFKHAPKRCSVVSVGRCGLPKSGLKSDLSLHQGSPVSEKSEDSKEKSLNTSPRTVLIDEQRDSDSPRIDDDSSTSFGSSNLSEPSPLPPPPPPLVLTKHKRTSLKRVVSSLFRLPFDLSTRTKTNTLTSYKEMDHNQPLLTCFSYEEISTATNDFHSDNIVGRGGYSEVYRGDLKDGTMIAIKRLAKDNTNPKKEKEFLIELGIIGHVSHPNTASLTGYCVENGLYLVFSYSPNGNLCTALHGDASELLNWGVRYKIALGVAKGLHYLHKCCKHRIIHRDIKASNVLLGLDYEPQITDFGLAKWLPSKTYNHAVSPVIEGTFGYLAPEYFMHGMVDEKTDVYAFGVLILEIITGRRPVDHSMKQNLLLWATPLVESGKIEELVDPRLEGVYEEDQVQRLVLAASHCVQQLPLCRPSMTEVLELLENGCGTKLTRSWRMTKISSDEVDDYSMAFGYDVPLDFNLEDDEDW